MRPFALETLTPGRWRNGGGVTREIASRPAGAEEFQWRASIADIDRDGPFSAFGGVDRTFTLLSGRGVRLSCPGVLDRLLERAGEPFAFSGDLELSAELSGGSCRVLNVMVRRGRWAARVERVTDRVVPRSGHAGVLLALRGSWQAGRDAVGPGGGVWWDAGDDAVRAGLTPLSPDASALWADLAPTG
ncbi:HutD family protein [Streptomyces sp. NPDC039028]|uniref:HutD/Ves family protein n=1 Tax=unclassified Streptomyces TaxID=2593676 RepID=UPI0033C4A3F8